MKLHWLKDDSAFVTASFKHPNTYNLLYSTYNPGLHIISECGSTLYVGMAQGVSFFPIHWYALVRPPRTGPGLARTKLSGASLLLMPSHARKRYKYNSLSVRALQVAFGKRFRTSHLEVEAHGWLLVGPGRDRYARFDHRALIH